MIALFMCLVEHLNHSNSWIHELKNLNRAKPILSAAAGDWLRIIEFNLIRSHSMVSRLLLSKLLRVKGARWTPLSALAQVRGEQDLEFCRKAVLEEVLRRCKSATSSPDVEVRSSSIPGAVVGVFATVDISAGTVLATYGGRFIPPISVPPIHGAPPTELCDLTGDYIYCCEGGGYLDGSNCLQPQSYGRAALARPSREPPSFRRRHSQCGVGHHFAVSREPGCHRATSRNALVL